MKAGNWRVRLTTQAQGDFHDIIVWTAETFGATQAAVYADSLVQTLTRLHAGPRTLGAIRPTALPPGIHALRMGGRGRHVVYFRVAAEATPPTIAVLRILHDGMDAPRHLDPETDANADDSLPV